MIFGFGKAPRAAPTSLVWLRRGTGAVSAVGEQHHTKALKKVWKIAPEHDNIVIALVPEPTNKHDRNAVRMDILLDGSAYTAGYIGREEARGYARVLAPLANDGLTGVGYGKIRIYNDRFEVYVRVSDTPSFLVPPAIADPAGVFIDGLFDMTVTGEENHQPHLKRYARRRDQLVFSLDTATIERGKYAGLTTFAVFLDGEPVGQLTRAMTEKHFNVIDSVIRSGRRPYLAGRIEEDHRGFQVILDAPSQPRNS